MSEWSFFKVSNSGEMGKWSNSKASYSMLELSVRISRKRLKKRQIKNGKDATLIYSPYANFLIKGVVPVNKAFHQLWKWQTSLTTIYMYRRNIWIVMRMWGTEISALATICRYSEPITCPHLRRHYREIIVSLAR